MKDNLTNKFKELENQFDIEEPTIGHFDRFEAKLNSRKSSTRNKAFKFISFIAIAASIILFVGIWIGTSYSNKGMELAGVSLEMKETQTYFINTINKELATIENERSGETEKVISDGLNQLKKLEAKYLELTFELLPIPIR